MFDFRVEFIVFFSDNFNCLPVIAPYCRVGINCEVDTNKESHPFFHLSRGRRKRQQFGLRSKFFNGALDRRLPVNHPNESEGIPLRAPACLNFIGV